jgi:nucleoside-diphosphate-sugar epimerase
MAKKKNIIPNVSIIGGTGFIGKHLVNHFLEKEVDSIRVLSRKKILTDKKNLKFIEGDLFSSNALSEVVSGQDLVVNLAYIAENYKANMDFIDKLTDSCLRAGVSKFVHCSSAVVAGRVNTSIINEETICNPFNEYEKTKLAIEERLLLNFKDKIQLIIVRPTSVFGDGGANLEKIANSLVYSSRIKNFIPIMVNKYRKMHLVPVEEVVAGIYYLANIEKNLSGEKFIICHDFHPDNNYFTIVNRLSSVLGINPYPKVFLPFSSIILVLILRIIGRTQLIPGQIYSNKKLYDHGFRSKVDFIESIDKFALSKF